MHFEAFKPAVGPLFSRYLVVASMLSLLVPLHSAHSAVLCVVSGDSVGLQDALATAATNGEDDIVELQSGLYSMPVNFELRYYPNTEQHDLTIEGGYQDFLGNPCGIAPVVPDATQTILDGGKLSLTLPDGTGSIVLKSITIENMLGTGPFEMPVAIGGIAASNGSIEIYNSVFAGNVSTTSVAVFLEAVGGSLLVQNSVFASNGSLGGYPSIELGVFQSSNTPCAEIVNTTFVHNTSAAPAVELNSSCAAIVANSIFWANTPQDLQIDDVSATVLMRDDLSNLDEATGTQASGLISMDPMFNSDFSLKDLSPLREAGSDGVGFFSPGQYDVRGEQRVYGVHPDLGAFEIQDVISAYGFDFQLPF